MDENILNYQNEQWQGFNTDYFISLSDKTLRKHLKALLEAQGICSLSYLELQEMVRSIEERQFEVFQQLRQLDYWLTCGDSEVIIRPRTLETYQRLHAQRRK